MIYMHCRIRVRDFVSWKAKMDADVQAQHDAGMYLKQFWRGIEDPNRAFFIMEIHSEEKARAFLNPKDVAESSKSAGVSEFEWYFVESIPVE